MLTLNELRKRIFTQIPTDIHLAPTDCETIARHKDLLLSWEEEIIRRHYDMLYAHEPTKKIFREGEREKLEQLLSKWWRRVINGPIDDDFWNWMTFVGLAHVQRKVKNPMMISAWGNIAKNVISGIQQEVEEGKLDAKEATALTIAFVKLGKIFTSLVAESYLTGIAEATGTNLALLENLASQEVQTVIEEVYGNIFDQVASDS